MYIISENSTEKEIVTQLRNGQVIAYGDHSYRQFADKILRTDLMKDVQKTLNLAQVLCELEHILRKEPAKHNEYVTFSDRKCRAIRRIMDNDFKGAIEILSEIQKLQ